MKKTWVLILALIIALTFCYWFRGVEIDDSYIILRYAENFAQTGQLVWNMGDKPYEGYSCFLYIVLLGGLKSLINVDLIRLAQVVGILSFLLSILVFWKFVNSVEFKSENLKPLVVLTFACMPQLAMFAVSRMDTVFNLLIVLLAFYFTYKERETWSLTFAALSLFSRIEGVYFWVAILFYWIVIKRKFGYTEILVLVIGIAYHLWRYIYFGHLISGPGMVKLGGFDFSHKSIFYASFKTYVPYLLLSLFFLGYWLGKNKRNFYLSLAVLGFTFVLSGVSQLMNFNNRFFMPVFPATILLAGMVIDDLGIWRKSYLSKTCVVGIIIFAFYVSLEGVRYSVSIYGKSIKSSFVKLGQDLYQMTGGKVKVVVSDIGAISYYSKMHSIDLWGLTDEFIARGEGVADYVYNQNPEYLVICSSVIPKQMSDLGRTNNEKALVDDKRIASYEVIKGYTYTTKYFIFLLKNKALKETLEKKGG